MAALLTIICVTQALAQQADQPALGSPDFKPSPENPFGWRGDGSGRFPAADPPLRWGKVAKGVKGLRAQATKPKDGDTGKPIPDGVIHDWLVLGPMPAEDAAKAMQVKGEKGEKSEASPDAADKFGALAWKTVTTDSSLLDFYDVLGAGAPKKDIALAHAYVYAQDKVKVRLLKEIDLTWGTWAVQVYVNGVLLGVTRDFELEKGWNRLMFRVACGELSSEKKDRPWWFLQPIMYGAPGSETQDEGIAWNTRLPGWSIASPVIAGDKIFVLSELRTLCCLDKKTGRILWARTATYYDAATDEEKKANPEVFKEIAPLVAKLAEIDKALAAEGGVKAAAVNEKITAERQINKLMGQVDKDKYIRIEGEESGASAHTPVTDGKSIWVTYFVGLTLRYDLDGALKWVYCTGRKSPNEHGYTSSPCLIAGRLVVHSDPTIALDAESGKLVWSVPAGHIINNASVIGVRSKDPMVSIGPDVIDVQAGKMLLTSDSKMYPPARAGLSSSIVRDDTVIRIKDVRGEHDPAFEKLDFISLADKPPKIAKTVEVPEMFVHPTTGVTNEASPLYHDGLVYMVDVVGMLSVIDANTYEIVYQKLLDVDNGPAGIARGTLGASPALAGKYIYIFGNGGTCLVIEPGRKFKQVAKNRIEAYCNGSELEFPWQTVYQTGIEQTLSCPVFEGKRMYYRGLANLYCIEEKK